MSISRRAASAVASAATVAAMALFAAGSAGAADVKVLTAGAMKGFVLAVQPGFEAASGHKLVIDNDTAGGLAKKREAGEAFDMAIITPAVIDDLIKNGKIVAGSRTAIAKVGVGVAVKEGAPKPDISTVEAFKKTLLAAKTVAYIDPASGGSSGIYVAGLLQKIGIANDIKPKERLQAGGDGGGATAAAWRLGGSGGGVLCAGGATGAGARAMACGGWRLPDSAVVVPVPVPVTAAPAGRRSRGASVTFSGAAAVALSAVSGSRCSGLRG